MNKEESTKMRKYDNEETPRYKDMWTNKFNKIGIYKNSIMKVKKIHR